VNISRKLRIIPAAIWLWLTVFTLYLPAWHAGFVTDAIDWLHDTRLPFPQYLNRTNSTVHALYQFTQLVTLGIYKLFGTARLPWHLLFITLQAGAAYMLYLLCGRIISAANLRHPRRIAYWGALLFCISPYLSEVIVWKACFHYLQGFMLMLGILICAERYIYTRHRSLPWIAAFLFLLSSFSLEIFYLTPIFSATLIFYYRCLGWDMALKPRTWLAFLIPQLAIFALHLAIFHSIYGEWASHGTGGAFTLPLQMHFATVAKYAFHLLLFGRFWPQDLKEQVYLLCEQWLVLIPLYSILLLLIGWLVYKCRKGYGREQASLLLLIWALLAVTIALPMPFERLFDLSGNRYLYLAVAFIAMLLSLAVNAVTWTWAKVGLACGFILISSFLTLRTNRHWQTSERINTSLLQNIPDLQGRTTILLSMPYCYKGIPMINAWPQGNFQRSHDVLYRPPLRTKIYDGSAFNMISPTDGSEAEIVNDSTIKVTLRQWGTWWWYMDFGGRSYETPDYKLNMIDQGHCYELTLKHPISNYTLLQQVGDKWQVVGP
jgi:hypothetical protein